ncbi:hypothetical protein TELCIR_15808 [Teladorsagia circumcincta]|uniref:DH domain-containing protein n=1 Tax=Teladorsagia circumcincta TaxID=45464 RepID=A0A2G9TYU9_TELCI|nr:hypothetical protein TELCIR_15808 [Teladorsagia circumcincta]
MISHPGATQLVGPDSGSAPSAALVVSAGFVLDGRTCRPCLMRMADDERRPSVCVSLLREQIKEKINAARQKDAPHVLSGSAVPIYPLPQQEDPPPVPPHKSSLGDTQLSTPKSSKPPVAPKPPHISRQVRKPTIFVSDGDDAQNNAAPFAHLKSSRTSASQSPGEVSESDAHPRSTRDVQRPRSTVSTTSTENGDAAEFSDSDSDEGRQNGTHLLQRTDTYLNGPSQLTLRRPSALCFNGDPSIHEKIVDELKRQGIIRSSDRMMKRRTEASSKDAHRGRNSLQPSEGLASCDTSLSTTLSEDTPSTCKKDNAHSSRSSIVTTTSAEYESVPDYNTGDADEDKRLKKLHYAANEFYSVQKLFLKYLRDMGEVYPEYVTEFGKRLGKDLLARQGTQLHVVRQLQLHYEQLIRFHQLLLDEFSSRLETWSSLKPNMADIIIKYADFLKICKPFLLEKSRFVQELTQLRLENKDFDNATVAFEQKIFNRGVGAVVQQLDQVHQNFMRYKILMMSYNNYLVEGSEEQKKTLDNAGTLFPINILLRGSDGIVRIRVPKGGGEKDDEPVEQYVIYGFGLKETEVESGGTLFELTHRNQIVTDRKEHIISFRVEHEKSILKWRDLKIKSFAAHNLELTSELYKM